MYVYQSAERQFLHRRAEQFRSQVGRYRAGELSDDEFAQLRLRNGLYQEKHAPMLRIAIPYGQLCAAQLDRLAAVSREYDRGYGHFTTRQNLQLNWPSMDRVPDILHQLAEVGLHAIQSSGSCVRNITCDPLAGAAADEYTDPRPWCELVRQWSVIHPEFNWLPRKFKIAFSGARDDRAAIRFHDIGIEVYGDNPDDCRFRVWVGGGLGRTPVIGKVLVEDLEADSLLDWLRATIRVYNLAGRRDNKYRARIKILVNDLGLEAFRQQVIDSLARSGPDEVDVSREIARIRTQFVQPPQGTSAGSPAGIIAINSPAFIRWKSTNTAGHQREGFSIVYLPLKNPGDAPGDLDADGMEAMAHIARTFGHDDIRVTPDQNLVLPHVRQADLFALWSELSALGRALPNSAKVTDMVACPGLDYCSLANASTIPLSREIATRLSDIRLQHHIGDLRIKMSGCMNACGHHHIADIGILGVDKKGEQWYQVTLGGSPGNRPRIGARLGPAIHADHIADAVIALVDLYTAIRLDGETFIQTLDRCGMEPFRCRAYNDPDCAETHRAA